MCTRVHMGFSSFLQQKSRKRRSMRDEKRLAYSGLPLDRDAY